ncbi:MAG: LexA family transcriptional regulator [Campylobacterales bacterium]|nr:LexA family transcriptional regulator [Campylobacterales bacterium]
MSDLADRIREVRKVLGGISQKKLAEIVGCTDGKIKAWEQGTTPNIKPKDVFLLANKYGFNYDWLADGKGEMMQNKGDLLLRDISVTNALLHQNISIPYFKDINDYVFPHGVVNNTSHSFISLPDEMVAGYSSAIEAIHFAGNSMNPTIKDKDIILIDSSIIDPTDGDVFLLYLCEEVYVKRVFIDPKSKELTLCSDNPIFPKIKADCEDFKLVGKVVGKIEHTRL